MSRATQEKEQQRRNTNKARDTARDEYFSERNNWGAAGAFIGLILMIALLIAVGVTNPAGIIALATLGVLAGGAAGTQSFHFDKKRSSRQASSEAARDTARREHGLSAKATSKDVEEFLSNQSQVQLLRSKSEHSETERNVAHKDIIDGNDHLIETALSEGRVADAPLKVAAASEGVKSELFAAEKRAIEAIASAGSITDMEERVVNAAYNKHLASAYADDKIKPTLDEAVREGGGNNFQAALKKHRENQDQGRGVV
jgi:hypothetical protein